MCMSRRVTLRQGRGARICSYKPFCFTVSSLTAPTWRADDKPVIKSEELLALDAALDGALSDIVSLHEFKGKKVGGWVGVRGWLSGVSASAAATAGGGGCWGAACAGLLTAPSCCVPRREQLTCTPLALVGPAGQQPGGAREQGRPLCWALRPGLGGQGRAGQRLGHLSVPGRRGVSTLWVWVGRGWWWVDE